MEQKHWYVGFVKASQDAKVAQSLTTLGIEHFYAVRKVRRRWSDRIKIKEEPLIRGIIFIHTDNLSRVALLSEIYGLYAYMARGVNNPIVVPDNQMKTFIDMVTKSNKTVEFHKEHFKPGDKIRIINGPLVGVECELIKIDGKNYAMVRLASIGNALTSISMEDVEKIME